MKYLSLPFLLLILQSQLLFSQDYIELYTNGMKNYNQGYYSEAIADFNSVDFRSITDEELYSTIKFYTAESYLGIQQTDAAITHFEAFISKFPTSNYRELGLYRLGNLYFEKKLYERSRANLVELVNLYPSSEYSGSSFHLIGETFIEENDLDKAENFFNSAVNSNKNNSFVDRSIYSLANLYENKGQYLEAVKYYDKLLGYHKNSELAALSQLRIGVCYFRLEEYDNAVLELSDPLLQNLNVDEQNEADFILANSFYELKEYNNATDAYRRILKNSPSSDMLDRIRYGLAWIHFQQRNYNDAHKLFSLLSSSKDDSIAVKSLFWSGEAKRYDGKYGESIEIHRNFVDKYPDHPYSDKVKLNIGISKFSQNSFTESEETLYDLTSSHEPITKARALTLLGEIKLRKQNYSEASEFFERGLDIPNLPSELEDRCNFGLGVSKFFSKNNIQALRIINKIDVKKTKINIDKLNFYKGEINFYLGNYVDAIINYKKVNNTDKTLQKNTTYGLAYSYFNSKDFTKAAHFFNNFLKNFGNDDLADESRLRLADCYYGTKSFNQASKYYKRALIESNKFANDDRSFFNYAQALFKQGDASEAISILNKLQHNFPSSKYADDSQYLIGWINFQSGKFEIAVENYGKLFSNYPDSPLLPIAHYSIGDSYFNIGNYQESIASYNRVISQFPSSNSVYDAVNGIQYCYIVQDKQEEAINYLEGFIKSHPEKKFIDKIQFKKAEIYYSSGQYESAVEEYNSLIENYSGSSLIPNSYYWMGKSSVLIEDNDDAKEYFEEVIDISLNTEVGFNSILELGKIYRLEKNYENEINLYDDVMEEIETTKRKSEIKYIKAQSFIEQEKIAEAYQVLNEIVNQRDGSLFYHKAEIELGILELSRSNYESSLYLLRDVANNREDDIAAQAQYYIGLNYFEQEKLAESITELIKVRSLYSAYDEWYTRSLILLGDSYVKINDKANAADMYKAVLKRHRNNVIAKEVKSKLDQL